MNKQSFYKGILAELEKIADQPLQVVDTSQPKKPFYKSPLFWGGLGAAGLGGYGLYKSMQGNQVPVNSAVASSESPPTPTEVNQLNPNSPNPVTSTLKHILPVAENFTWGGGLVDDAIRNPDQHSLLTRGLEGGTGMSSLGIEGLASSTLKPLTSKILTTAAHEGAKAIVRGGIMPAYIAGMAGQYGIAKSTDAALQHSDLNSGAIDLFKKYKDSQTSTNLNDKSWGRSIREQVVGNPEQIRLAKLNKEIYNPPVPKWLENEKNKADYGVFNKKNLEGYVGSDSSSNHRIPTYEDTYDGIKALGNTPTPLQSDIKQVTEPGTLARIGYGWGGLNLPKILGGKGLNLYPDMQSNPFIQKELNNMYKDYSNNNK